MCDAPETLKAGCHPSLFPITRLGPDDTAAMTNFVATLDEAALQVRFDRFMTPAMVRAHYEAVDWNAATAWAWLADCTIRAVAETYFHDAGRGLEAEVALCVSAGWRGRGIGRLLVARALAEAAERGAWRTVMVTGAHGCGHRRIARRLGGTLDASTGLLVFAH